MKTRIKLLIVLGLLSNMSCFSENKPATGSLSESEAAPAKGEADMYVTKDDEHRYGNIILFDDAAEFIYDKLNVEEKTKGKSSSKETKMIKCYKHKYLGKICLFHVDESLKMKRNHNTADELVKSKEVKIDGNCEVKQVRDNIQIVLSGDVVNALLEKVFALDRTSIAGNGIECEKDKICKITIGTKDQP